MITEAIPKQSLMFRVIHLVFGLLSLKYGYQHGAKTRISHYF
jgi:hypothetical protein